MSHHHHHHYVADTHRIFAVAVGLNLFFAVLEAGLALQANSASLLADAGHNLTDVLALLFAWLANWLLQHRANVRYSYGYKRTTILAAFGNAFLLVMTAGGIVYQSVWQWLHPAAIHEWTIIIVALLGIVINAYTAWLFRQKQQEDLNLRGAFLHLAYDALLSLGVVLGAVLILLTGWALVDVVLGLVIALVILWGTWSFLRDSVYLLCDAVPSSVDREKVCEYLLSLAGVTAIHDLHIWGLSTREIALTAHIVMPEGMLEDKDYVLINQQLQVQFSITHVTLQVEKGSGRESCAQIDCC